MEAQRRTSSRQDSVKKQHHFAHILSHIKTIQKISIFIVKTNAPWGGWKGGGGKKGASTVTLRAPDEERLGAAREAS